MTLNTVLCSATRRIRAEFYILKNLRSYVSMMNSYKVNRAVIVGNHYAIGTHVLPMTTSTCRHIALERV